MASGSVRVMLHGVSGVRAVVFALLLLLAPGVARAACRPVADAPTIQINQANLDTLAAMHLTRAAAFAVLRRTSIPETQGCWAGSTGNADDELLSVGAMQWNYGQQTLQFLLFKYRQGFQSQAAFDTAVHALMPRYGALVFSEGCRHEKLSPACRQAILAHQHHGRLDPDFAAEWDALFNSDPMVQVQVDRFLSVLTSVRFDLVRLFGDREPSELQIKWALDTKTQQGSFPQDTDIARYRQRAASSTPAERHKRLLGIVNWYAAMCLDYLSEGTHYDQDFNERVWRERIDRLYTPRGVAPEEPMVFDLLQLSWIRSRESGKMGGAYQALTFQRRATIILGCGSVAGRHIC